MVAVTGEFFKGAFLQLFIPNDKSSPVPEQDFAFIAGLTEENKQMPTEWILAHETFGEHRKLVETAAHIGRLRVNEDLDRRGQLFAPCIEGCFRQTFLLTKLANR